MRRLKHFVARTGDLGSLNSSGSRALGRFAPALRLAGGLLAALVILPVCALATGDKVSRYPFDPVCPWGRLANGKGMIHRCITEDEALTLATPSAPGKEPSPKTAAEGKVSAEKTAPKPEPQAATPAHPKGYDLTVGPIVADEGTITVGRLGLPIDLYRKCIEEGGGLSKTAGTVVVKFFVRAEHLRAEAASLESHEGVSEKSAACIAAVVDRRKVGTPSAPMTGAKLTISVQEKK